jgi:hypothetical protein
MASKRQGRIVWHELLTHDKKKALAFYPKLVGWSVTEFPGPQPYHMWTNNGENLGGTMQMPADSAGAPSHWLMYMCTENADETVATATKLGPKVFVKPTDIPTVGRFAVLADPQGAMFATLQPATDAYKEDTPPAIGEFSWHELTTDDWQAAFTFYQTLFGWEAREAMDMGPMGKYQMWSRAGVKHDLGGIMNRTPDMPPSFWNCYIRVPSVDQSAPQVIQSGGQVMKPPMDVPGGDRIAICTDPTGAIFSLHSSKA